MVAVGEVGVEHGGEGEAGEGDAQAGHQLGHTHRGGHAAAAHCIHSLASSLGLHCPQRMLLVWLEAGDLIWHQAHTATTHNKGLQLLLSNSAIFFHFIDQLHLFHFLSFRVQNLCLLLN